MYLGNDFIINTKNIVGIFDLDTSTTSRITKSYLAMAQRSGRIKELTMDLPKSFVVSQDQGETTVYLTQASTATLMRRLADARGIEGL